MPTTFNIFLGRTPFHYIFVERCSNLIFMVDLRFTRIFLVVKYPLQLIFLVERLFNFLGIPSFYIVPLVPSLQHAPTTCLSLPLLSNPSSCSQLPLISNPSSVTPPHALLSYPSSITPPHALFSCPPSVTPPQ